MGFCCALSGMFARSPLTSHLSPLAAQSAPPGKVVKSIERIFGPGTRVDTVKVLKDVDVLVYREPQGGEVAYEPWRKQFRGKTAEAPLVVGKDIKNISGATISSHSVTLGVRRTLAELSAWRAAGRIR